MVQSYYCLLIFFWFLFSTISSDYDEGLNCIYTINKYSIDVCRVELTFPNFNLEYSLNCLNDYLGKKFESFDSAIYKWCFFCSKFDLNFYLEQKIIWINLIIKMIC